MLASRAVLGLFIAALCSTAAGKPEKVVSPHSSLAHIKENEESKFPWDSPTCTGSNDPPAKSPYCYSGTKMGEAVTIKVDSFSQGIGSVFVTGSGLAPVKCQRSFSKAQQMISVPGLEQCLPGTVKPSGMKYCSDQDQVILDATVAMLSVELVLNPAPCPAVFLEDSSQNDLLSHSAWIWDAKACTGSADPPSHAPFCYSGSKMGEIVTIRVNDFDNISSIGSVQVSGSGLKTVKCERGFSKPSKAEQLISVPKLTDCLPSTVKPTSMKFCSDQNQVLLDATVGIIPVQLTLIPSPCPAFFLEDNLKGGVLLESEWGPLAWASTTCTGLNDPPASAPYCYSGTKMGEGVTIKVDHFAQDAGSVFVSGSGLAAVKCQRGFSKAQQMINVPGLEQCLPSTVKPSGMKYCSDQDQVILDATVGLISVEMILKPAPCPAVFLERASKVMEGQIMASGVQRLIRSE